MTNEEKLIIQKHKTDELVLLILQSKTRDSMPTNALELVSFIEAEKELTLAAYNERLKGLRERIEAYFESLPI